MAKELGLIDELGNLQDAIKIAGELTGIKGEPEVVQKKEKFSFTDLLRGEFPKRLMDNVFQGISLKYLMIP